MIFERIQPASVHRAFEEQARVSPESTALLFDDEVLSYRALNHRANRIARFLLSLGMGEGAQIALSLERSPELIAVLIAILKTGGVYVPLDPAYPAERLAFMLRDSGAAILVTNDFLRQRAAEIESQPADDLSYEGCGGDSAYIMYTSGSTGVPKGALIRHRGILRLVKGADYVHFGPDEVFLQMAPASFDASTFEIWGALLNGAALAIMPPGAYSLEAIGAALERHRVTTLWLTAGLFHVMVEQRLEDLRPLRQLVAGGDALSPAHVKRVLERWPSCAVVNGYGPTETTTFACCHRIAATDLEHGSVPIGRPISRTSVYILDENRKPVEAGGEGEIYIGGDGVAAGYLNRPELTRERFVPDPFDTDDAARLYRTGDRGRMRADGCIEFLGRLDGQFKINGYRVEPGEIEATLMCHPVVSQAVATVLTDGVGRKRMVAYAVARQTVSGNELKAFLATKLPAPMVPAEIVMVGSLPLTANGKVDRARLPVPSTETGTSGPAPADTIEEIVLAAWRKALGRDEIATDRNFFDLGGDSLRLMAVHSEIQQILKRDFPLLTLLEYPTVRSFGAWLRGGRDKTNPASGLAEAGSRARNRREGLLRQAQLKQARQSIGANL